MVKKVLLLLLLLLLPHLGLAQNVVVDEIVVQGNLRVEESAVLSVRDVPAGAPVGYGARFRATRPTRIGLVAMGYADGYPRSAPDGTPVAVDGQLTRLIGRVSMDMMTVDLTDLPHSGPGSRVELWGPLVSVNRVAEGAGTIAYEVLCNVKRVRFDYRD